MDKPLTTYIEKKNAVIVYPHNLDKEIIRKGIHSLIATVPFIASGSKTMAIMLLLAGTVLYLTSEIFRINGKQFTLISRMTLLLTRDENKQKIEFGPVTLAAGALLSLLIFPAEIAKLAILSLAFGDSIACIAGKKLASFTIPHTGGKTFAGSIACFMAIYLVAFKLTLSMPTAFALASVGTFLEALPIKDLDNLVLPVGVGVLAYLIQLI